MVFVYTGYGRQRQFEELQWLRKRARQKIRLRMHQKGKLNDRAQEVEECLAEQAFLNQALLKLCLDKGLFSKDEFVSLLRDVDLLDGEADGKLDMPGIKAEKKKAREAEEKARKKAPSKPRPKIPKRRR